MERTEMNHGFSKLYRHNHVREDCIMIRVANAFWWWTSQIITLTPDRRAPICVWSNRARGNSQLPIILKSGWCPAQSDSPTKVEASFPPTLPSLPSPSPNLIMTGLNNMANSAFEGTARQLVFSNKDVNVNFFDVFGSLFFWGFVLPAVVLLTK